MRIKCPSCGRGAEGTPADLPYRPFCSERCRSVDLGNWLDAAYRISAPVAEEDMDEGMPGDSSGESTDKDPVKN